PRDFSRQVRWFPCRAWCGWLSCGPLPFSPCCWGYRSETGRSVASDVRCDHLAGIDDAVEFCRADGAKLQRRLLERQVVIQGVMGNPGCLVVADHRAERGDQHQGTLHEMADLLEVRLHALDEELAEIHTAVSQEPDRFGDIEDQQRLVDVHL